MAAVYTEEEVGAAFCTAAKGLGYNKVFPEQKLAVTKFVSGQDVFVSLPTGGGKSLCYCSLPGTYDLLRRHSEPMSMIVVVSPLVALMKDQVASMRKKNVKAVFVSECAKEEEDLICKGHFQIIFLSPEALLTDMRWRDMLLSPVFANHLIGLVVDEAHCVKKWGKTFRKEFSHIGEARSLVPKGVCMMALTATATKSTRHQVCRLLGMTNPAVVSISPNRRNIKYIVKDGNDLEIVFEPLAKELRRDRSKTGKTTLGSERLEPVGAPDMAPFRLVDMFTACTHAAVKNDILESFCATDGVLRVIVATVAFGMGLDCPNVRKIIHWGPSNDIELYMQETGRAGRDRQYAEAILYPVSSPLNKFTEEPMKKYTKNKETCRRKMLLQDFDGDHVSNMQLCECCDVCEVQCSCDNCSQKKKINDM